MSQFGVTPFGEEGPYGGPGLLTILAVVPVAQNRIAVFFDGIALADDATGIKSAINVENYVLTPIDPTIPANPPYIPEGTKVPTRRIGLARARPNPDDPTQIWIWTDRDMEGNVLHQLDVVGMLHGADCEDFSGLPDWQFFAPSSPVARVAPDRLDQRFRDLDDGNLPGFETLPGVWRYKSSGDIALQPELESFKKRLIRRLTQQRRAFTWSNNGVELQVGQPLTATVLTNIAQNVAAMARADSLVASAGCTAQARIIGNDAYVELLVTVELLDGRDYLLSLSVPTK